ncbi:fluoride efflux transporter CrcB [Caballeronia sp. LZ033]|uniref:fluoride efflux transporter CrcB n=1 Tax=Caballeronia sp. LZ033 TaxID=3038566 RepID=UPI002859E3AF|nr:fluoride efflux transporter CrcB [Caballeronia sp. LZ033]MDR5818272.1 fluoride efflux transporter CrcB [Caballeronia sp. LZ033]
MQSFLSFVLVFVGGGLGSMARHLAGRASLALFGPSFPYGTLGINVLGSFAMGVVAGWFALRGHADQSVRLFLTTGIIGGFTTYSTFSLETALLWERGDVLSVMFYVGGTLLLGFVGIFGGLALARAALGA